jgi:hypothetical protein
MHDVSEVGQINGRRGHLRRASSAPDGLDHLVGSEHGRHRTRVVDHDIGNVQIAGRSREHDRDGPSLAGHPANPTHIAHVEQAPEILAQAIGDGLPNGLASHIATIDAMEPCRQRSVNRARKLHSNFMSPACVPNIGPRERARRVGVGVVSLGVGLLLAALLIATGVGRPWRLVVFGPIWVGAVGLFQAREKTCVALVARAERNMDGGVEAVSDPAELAQLKAQARRVHWWSLAVAAILSAVVFAMP